MQNNLPVYLKNLQDFEVGYFNGQVYLGGPVKHCRGSMHPCNFSLSVVHGASFTFVRHVSRFLYND